MLSQAQMAHYHRNGFVLVSGLIPEKTIVDAEVAMWSVLDMDRGDRSSWSPLPGDSDGVTTVASQGVIEHFGLKDPALTACCTPEFYEAQSQLANENSDAFHCRKSEPEAVWTRSVFPVSQNWNHHSGHADGQHRPFEVFPGSFRVSSLTYLDSGVARGGGTVVWPGSHRTLGEAATKDPGRYRTLPDFERPTRKFDLGEPIEIQPSRGDVLFFHYLLVHAGSLNTGHKPRFALRWMCTCDTCRIWEKHGKWNIWMP